VELRNAYSGICGSDLHVYCSPEASGLDFTRPHPVTGSMPPQILGHEFAGTVAALGDGVEGYEVGDRVAVWPVYYCGYCAACRNGRVNVCRNIGFHGLTSHGGGMAEFTTVAADKLHKLPDAVDLRMGALVEPMAVAWHAVDQSGCNLARRR
jgi:(R,R)-butanediol dehydrogenase/meso-butanediol dehydrogenase/diacetyl reductase